MPSRRQFLTTCTLAGAALGTGQTAAAPAAGSLHRPPDGPMILSTWNFGQAANAAAWQALSKGGQALDAVEQGARQAESDVDNMSVGLGGLPDRDGHVTLDACIMDHRLEAGSVCFLEDFEHPVSVARKVMEETPHVMLSGDGARQFALEQGFKTCDLLTDRARHDWVEWSKKAQYAPKANAENHDTLGILALDHEGRLAGACTTSGMAYKLHGRVGDSPIIGAALYVDGDVGAATATGHGEYVMRTLGGFLVVELMRQGYSPQKACEEAIERVARGLGEDPGEVQVGYLALDTQGRLGAYSLQAGFQYAVKDGQRDQIVDCPSRY